MSGALAGAATLFTLASPAIQASGILPAWIRAKRHINKIIPDCVIEEQHTDRVQVTQHPIASGRPIADHMYKLPSEITIRMGWTNANPIGAFVGAGGLAGGIENMSLDSLEAGFMGPGGVLSTLKESRTKEIYDQLLKMMDPAVTKTPFDISTGKRDYKNMVLVELGIRTDHTSEYALMVEAHFQEVLIVKTERTTQPAMTDQPTPDKTATPTEGTQKQPDLSVLRERVIQGGTVAGTLGGS